MSVNDDLENLTQKVGFLVVIFHTNHPLFIAERRIKGVVQGFCSALWSLLHFFARTKNDLFHEDRVGYEEVFAASESTKKYVNAKGIS
jgi:hypothetical protein